MARLGFVDQEGNVSHISSSSSYTPVKKKKKKDEGIKTTQTIETNDIRTQKTEQPKKSTVGTVNSEGYTETSKKYGDYKYQDYANKKDYKIYTKDNKSYYYDEKNKRYVDMDEQSMTSKDADKKEYKNAVKQGYKGSRTYNSKDVQVEPSKVADKVALESYDLTKEEKEKYKKSLIKQEKQKGKETNFVKRSGTGIDALTSAWNNQVVNPNSAAKENIIRPISNAGRIYESGKMNNELALEWYKKMEGKPNKADELQAKVDTYNRFNQDVASGDIGALGQSIQDFNTQVESFKNQGIGASIGGVTGGATGAFIGLKSGNPIGGAIKGAKLGSKLGYAFGSTPYMYKLEAGNQYKDLIEMGVSHKKAKKVAKAVGTINAAIESGENLIDLLSFEGAGKIATNEVTNKALKQMRNEVGEIVEELGEKDAKNYLTKLYGSEIAENIVKTYGKNVATEAIEEGTQEGVGILGERYATGSEGIDRGVSLQQDLQRIGQSGLAGGMSALVMGIPTSLGGNAVSYGAGKANNIISNRGVQNGNILNSNDNTVSNTNQIREIIEQKNNGQIDVETANQRIADVQNGTYQQNQNNQAVIQEAKRKFDAINQAEASGVYDSERANQERQALTNTINQMSQPQQNETQERVVQETQQETPKQEVKSNDNKAEQVENQTIKVEQKKKTSPLDILTKNERQQYDIINEKRVNGQPLSQEDKNTLRSFQNKWNNYKETQQRKVENTQENKSNIKYEDLSKDIKATRYDKKMYAKAKNTDMDMSEYDKTMEFITPNRAGNYSKQQLLSLAEELGKKSKATTGAELKQEAINYWVNKEPYKKTDSKTKYFGMEEFLKSYYKGAGVGTKIETQEETPEVQEVKQDNNAKKQLPHSSKVNEIGYHASNNKFDKYDTSKIGTGQGDNTQGKGINLASVKEAVEGIYGDNVYETKIDLKNAYTVDDKKLLSTFEKDFGYKTNMENISDELKKKGYDGIVINVNGNKLYTVFDSNNAKITNGQTPKAEEKPKVEKNKPTNSIKEIRQEVEEKTNKTMSKHIETSSKATNTVEDIKNMDYDNIVYDTKTHEQSQEQALRELQGKDIDTNINDIHAKFRGTERLTNVDSAKITELMKQTKSLADDAAKNNNDTEYNKRMEQFRTLKGDYAVALSESGQFTEYAKVIKELDPETQVDVLRKVIEKEQRRGNKKYEDVTLNEDLIKKYKEAKTDEERDAIMEEIKDDTARQIKITLVDKANEFRFLSMLGNVKTHGRNIFGNVGMYSLQSFKDGVAAIGEDVYNKVSKNGLETRSKTLKPATKEVSNFVNEKVDSFMTDIKNKYNESRGMKGDLEGRTKKFSDNNIIGKALNKASDINSKALDLEDRYFSSKMTKQAMKGFLTANGIETNADIEAHPELVAQALDYALFKGKEATFHQDSTTATAIRNMRDKLYTGSGFSKLGGLAIDTTLPFVSTPANIAKNALEYTPIIGFGDINKQFQNAPNNMKANVIIDSLSKQFTGGALMAVGAYLASQGLVKGSGNDDKEDKTEASLGNASYSIKIGNSTYDLSWLSPTAIPFFEGVEVFNAFKKANSKGGLKATDTADLIDTMFGTLNPMTDMSVLQSIERVITSITYGGNAVKSATSTTFSSYLQQYIPTLFSQIAQVGDTKQRNTNTGGNVIEKTIDQIKYKIPGARNTLPEKVDVWGDTNKTAGNVPQRMFEAFLSPANRKDYKVDNTTKELERLARETDDTSMLPTVKNKKLRVNGEDHDLKGKDYVDLQKTYGKTAKKNLDKLTKSKAYKNADDNEKKSMVGKLYDYASYKAKENYAKKKGINFDSGNQTSFAMIDAFGIPYEKYVENQVSGNQGASDMLEKLNGAGLSKAQKGAVMNYYNRAYYVNEDELYDTLENSNLSEKQKELIRAKYEKNITDSERERYQRADKIGVDYDLYTNFRNFATKARGESRSGGPTKKQKVINWIQEQELTAEQKYNLYYDYINNQGIFSYYK